MRGALRVAGFDPVHVSARVLLDFLDWLVPQQDTFRAAKMVETFRGPLPGVTDRAWLEAEGDRLNAAAEAQQGARGARPSQARSPGRL